MSKGEDLWKELRGQLENGSEEEGTQETSPAENAGAAAWSSLRQQISSSQEAAQQPTAPALPEETATKRMVAGGIGKASPAPVQQPQVRYPELEAAKAMEAAAKEAYENRTKVPLVLWKPEHFEAFDEEKRLKEELDRATETRKQLEDAANYARNQQLMAGMTPEARNLLSIYYAWASNPMRNVYLPDYGIDNTAMQSQAMDAMKKLMDMGYTHADVTAMAETAARGENEETAQRVAEAAKESAGFWGSIASIPANFIGSATGTAYALDESLRKLTGNSAYETLDPNLIGYMPSQYASGIRQETASRIEGGEDASATRKAFGQVGSMLYQGALSAADSFLRVALSGGSSGYAGALAGLGSFQSAYQDAAAKGATPQQALLMGVASAGIEALTEKYSVEAFLNAPKVTDVKSWLKSAAVQAGVEFSEEEASFIANLVADHAIMGDKSEYHQRIAELMREGKGELEAETIAFKETLMAALEAGVIGAISGGMMGTVSGGADLYSSRKAGVAQGQTGQETAQQPPEGAEMAEKPRKVNPRKQAAKPTALAGRGDGAADAAREVIDSIVYPAAGETGTDQMYEDRGFKRDLATALMLRKAIRDKSGAMSKLEVRMMLNQARQELNGVSGDAAAEDAMTREKAEDLRGLYSLKTFAYSPAASVETIEGMYEKLPQEARDEAERMEQAAQRKPEAPAVQNTVSEPAAVQTPVEQAAPVQPETPANSQAPANLEESQPRAPEVADTKAALDALARDYHAGRISGEEYDRRSDALWDERIREEQEYGEAFPSIPETGRKAGNGNTAQEAEASLRGTERSGYEQTGENVSDEGGQRDAGAGAGEQTGAVAEGAEESETGWRREAHDRRNRGEALLLEWVSSRFLGIASGTDNKSVRVVPQEHWDEEMRRIARRIENETGLAVRYVLGPVEIRGADGAIHTARGVIDGNGIILQADNTDVSLEQLADHESYHAKAAMFPNLNEAVQQRILERYSAREFYEVMENYMDALYGIYDIQGAQGDAQAWEEIQQRILEEVLADAYAGINAFGAEAGRFSDGVNGFMTESGIGRRAEQDNGVRQTDGPPETRYSIGAIEGEAANYGKGVILDTDLFRGVKPRNWGAILGKFVYEKLAGTSVTVYNNDGDAEEIFFARVNDRVRKTGAKNSHRVLDELARYKGDNIRALATVHLSELLQTSHHSDSTDDHSHQWLDENGWEHRKCYLKDASGAIYEALLNIASGRDRKILYAINNVRKIDEERATRGAVPSTVTGRGSLTRGDSSGKIITKEDAKVKERFSVGDDAYMEAVNNGDMRTAQRMVDAAAERWGAYLNNDEANEVFPQEGRIRTFYHGTNTGDFTTFDSRLLGSSSGDLGWFGKGFYFAFSHKEAETYGGRVIPAYLRMSNPYDYSQLYRFNGSDKGDSRYSRFAWVYNIAKQFPDIAEGQHVWAYPNDTEEGSAVSWTQLATWMDRILSEKQFSVEEVELSDGDTAWELRADPKEKSFTGDDGETFEWTEYGMRQIFATEQAAKEPINQIGAYLKNVMGVDSIPRRAIERIDFSGALQRAGYDGILQSMSGDEAVVFSPEQIKTAEPVTYDDEGKVIPLSKRFQSGNADIRYSVSEQTGEEAQVETRRDRMPGKVQERLRSVDARLVHELKSALGADRLQERGYIQESVRELTDEIMRTGTVSQETMDRVFKSAWDRGIIVDRDMHDQYSEVVKYLRTTRVTLSERDQSDIADFDDFRNRCFGLLMVVKEGGTPVDSFYEELRDLAPNLFPEEISHPADRLMRMYEVSRELKIQEKNLDKYFGSSAAAVRRDSRAEFEQKVWDAASELRSARRFLQQQAEKTAEEKPPVTVEEAMEAWKGLKAARKQWMKAEAKHLLDDDDYIQVGRLLKGETAPEYLDPAKNNVRGILAVYEGKKEYARLMELLGEYRRQQRGKLRQEADSYLATAMDWKDKDIGLAYSRETMPRNIEDIVPDPELAKQINARYFDPIRDAEAAAVRMKDEYRARVAKLGLSRKVNKGDLVSEAHAVQLYGEAMDNIRILEQSHGRLESRDGKTLQDWQGIVENLFLESPSLDPERIKGAVAEFRSIYDELFQKMNQERVRWGYEPVNYRSGYFPHFQPGDGDGVLAQFGRVLGIDTQVVALPTTINGLTHTFKPGIQWFGNAQERLGFNTAYDAVEGFDKYIEGVSSVVCQTENIQRLRALAAQVRYRTTNKGIQEQIDAIYADDRLTEDEKQAKIAQLYEHGKFSLANFIVELDEYTNLLANKKSKFDRTIEGAIGRRCYTLMKWVENRVGANMIAGNLASALTNVIPLTQATAQIGYTDLLKGMWRTLAAIREGDSVGGTSSFLTNRRGSDPLVQTWSQKASEVLGKPMELIDGFVSGSIVRGAYEQNLRRGMSEEDAIHQADLMAARIMAERSKGGMPTLFSSTNPIVKLFTQFQLEVNNQFSEIFKDLPRAYASKGKAALACALLKYFLGAWLFNELYEKCFGRRSALDPTDMLLETGEDLFGENKVKPGTAIKNFATGALEELPFASGLNLMGFELDGGRIPVSSAIPDVGALWDAATNSDWDPKKQWKEAWDELSKPFFYLIPPFAGNQVSKIWKGAQAYFRGGSYSVDADGNDLLQYPVHNDEPGDFLALMQASLFGKSSLGTAQEWVEDEFDSLSSKQTAAYQDMLEAGVKSRDAYDLIDALRGAEATESQSKPDVQCGILAGSDVSADGKAIAFYTFVAGEKQRLMMDNLANVGADTGETLDLMMALRGTSKFLEEAQVLLDSPLSGDEKHVVLRCLMGEEEVNEEGKLTPFGKLQIALKTGMSVDDYLRFRLEEGDINDYLEYADLGLLPSDAAGLSLAMDALEPVEGKTSVSDAQRFALLLDSQLSEGNKAAIIGAMIGPEEYTSAGNLSAYGKFIAAMDSGMTADEYLKFRLEDADIGEYLEFVEGGLNHESAMELALDLDALEPEKGEEKVQDLQRWKVCVEFPGDDDDHLIALSGVMSDSQYAKAELANEFGVKPSTYVYFYELRERHDADRNGRYTQAEITATIDAMYGLSKKQRAALWQIVTGSSSAKNNPYDQNVAAAVLRKMGK